MTSVGMLGESSIRTNARPLAVLAGLLTAGLIGAAPILLTMAATAFVSVPVVFGYAALLVLPTTLVVALPAYSFVASRSPSPALRGLAVSAAGLFVFGAALLADLALPALFRFPLPLGLMIAAAATLFGGLLTIAFERSRRMAAIVTAVLILVAMGGWLFLFLSRPGL